LYPELDQLLYDIKHGFKTALDDDLNMSAAMASIFNNVRTINKLTLENRLDPEGASKIIDTFRGIDSVLKIFDFKDDVHETDVQHLIEQREQARREKNWDLADRIRDQLTARGITLKDPKIIND
jgi:cysteinyl-tRNA synthetase